MAGAVGDGLAGAGAEAQQLAVSSADPRPFMSVAGDDGHRRAVHRPSEGRNVRD